MRRRRRKRRKMMREEQKVNLRQVKIGGDIT